MGPGSGGEGADDGGSRGERDGDSLDVWADGGHRKGSAMGTDDGGCRRGSLFGREDGRGAGEGFSRKGCEPYSGRSHHGVREAFCGIWRGGGRKRLRLVEYLR